MQGSDLREAIRARLDNRDLLAERHQRRCEFSPSLAYGRHFGRPLLSTRPAAVMISLVWRDSQWTIPLTVRPQHLPDHPGQISFPGGRLERNESFQSAAEREFHEELGVKIPSDRVLGELLPLFVYNSNYFVRPFISVCDQTPRYVPCRHEVQRVIDMPVHCLLDPSLRQITLHQRGKVKWLAPAIQLGEDQVWGATAIMLGELSALLADIDGFFAAA